MQVYTHLRRPRQRAYLRASASKCCSVVVHRDASKCPLPFRGLNKNGQRPLRQSLNQQRLLFCFEGGTRGKWPFRANPCSCRVQCRGRQLLFWFPAVARRGTPWSSLQSMMLRGQQIVPAAQVMNRQQRGANHQRRAVNTPEYATKLRAWRE